MSFFFKEPISAFSDEEIGSPSDDSGLGLGWNHPDQSQRFVSNFLHF